MYSLLHPTLSPWTLLNPTIPAQLSQVNNLREIQALRRLSPHANIIKLQEVLYDQPTGRCPQLAGSMHAAGSQGALALSLTWPWAPPSKGACPPKAG